MKTNFTKPFFLGAAILALSACATMAPNQSIQDAQMRLSADYNDKKTAERGQGDLANAKSALALAQTLWDNGETEKSNHQLFMAQTYLDLAETRGAQAKVEASNTSMQSQALLAKSNNIIADKNSQINAMNNTLTTRDQQLADAQEQLRNYDMKTTELGSTMVLQDVSFETGRSELLQGGVNRLQPLINYLSLSPNTRVRIEGYTDNVGGSQYNMGLSLARANSVKAILTNSNVNSDRIETFGSGYEKPVATNSTPSGRQLNRRVEITLLKQPGN
ncbi:MAG: OmpA family protein [Caulobacterales bacterium]|nr:OmpA family protein [Caulobacterales bacterium]MCA0373732.1 OmpA family protein [Pseudomonadota bacterium]